MPDRHLTPEAFERLATEEMTDRDLTELLRHLLQVCPPCPETAEDFPPAAGEPPGAAAAGEDDGFPSIARLSESVWRRFESLASERGAAGGLFAELLRAPAVERLPLVEREPRFHNWGLADRLLRRSREASLEDPESAERLADLALAVAERLDVAAHGLGSVRDLQGRAWAHLGNARRVAGRLRAADEALRIAEHCLGEGSGDVLEKAQLLDLLASLRRDQRRFEEADLAVDRAISVYRSAGDRHLAGRALMKKAKIARDAGRFEDAVRLLRRAAAMIEVEREPRLLLCTRQNLVHYLSDLGRHEEAAGLLPEVEPLSAEAGSPLDRVRLRWLTGKVELGRGRLAEAEAALAEARDGFLAQAIGFDAALVALDLAAALAERGETAGVKLLAAEMLPVFAAEDIHREALAALLVFQRAAEAEEVTVGLVRRLSAYLEQARDNPRLRFEEPS